MSGPVQIPALVLKILVVVWIYSMRAYYNQCKHYKTIACLFVTEWSESYLFNYPVNGIHSTYFKNALRRAHRIIPDHDWDFEDKYGYLNQTRPFFLDQMKKEKAIWPHETSSIVCLSCTHYVFFGTRCCIILTKVTVTTMLVTLYLNIVFAHRYQ